VDFTTADRFHRSITQCTCTRYSPLQFDMEPSLVLRKIDVWFDISKYIGYIDEMTQPEQKFDLDM
jgi:hypothetical protein